jgi:acetylglutamate/LysW-gamma-L-alpha-aminoadipate kinase
MIVIKLGGSAGIDTERFLADLARLHEPYVLVHGANVELDALMRRLGVEPRIVTSSTGQVSRYTDAETMDLFLMAYAGKVNKRIVETLQRHGVNAIGLTGLDGRLARGRRKPRIRVVENGKARMLDGDFAGSIEEVDTSLLRLLMDAGYVPVLTPPAVSREGEAINVDGDKLAMEVAVALEADRLLIFSNTPGLLADLDNPASTVPEIDAAEPGKGVEHAQGRMKKKVLAAVDAVNRGVGEVILAGANRENAVEAGLGGAGTRIRGRTHAGTRDSND